MCILMILKLFPNIIFTLSSLYVMFGLTNLNNAAFHSYRDLLISKSKDIDTSIPENKYLLSLLYEKLDFKPDTPLDLPPDMISDLFISVYLQKNASFSDFKFPDSIQTSHYQIDNFSMENLFHYEYISKFGKESK